MSDLFISRWQIKPEKREEFLAIFNELYEAAKPLLETETTAYHYGWSRDENEFVAIEAWKNPATVAALRASPQFKDVFGRMMACASAPMRMELINDLSNDRSIFAAHPAGASTVHPEVGHGTIFL